MIHNTRRNGFHESYYDHACLVITELDVLDIDIVGMNSFNSFQRWWFDLFLLSHSDERAGDYYHSTHTMRMARMNHFRRHRGSIHPLSKFRNFWDMFILHVVVLQQILVYFCSSVMLRSIPEYMCYVTILLDGIIILDIFINARTGFIDRLSRKVELDQRLILLNYCSKKVFFHTASAIPLSFIMFLRYGNDMTCTLCKANHFNCVISFLTIISLFRIYELSYYWRRDRSTLLKTAFFCIMRIFVIITFIAIQFLHYSDTICLMRVMRTGDKSTPSYDSSFFDDIFQFIHADKSNISEFVYLNAHFWRIVNFLGRPSFGTMIQTTKIKYAIIYPHPLLKFLAYVLIITSMIWLLVEMYYVVTRTKYMEDEVIKSEHYLSNLVKARQLSEQFHLQMKDCFRFSATKIKVMEIKNGLYKSLPKCLKDEIAWQSFCSSLLRIPSFSDWPKEVIEQMVVLVKEHIYLVNDVVAEVGVPGNGLMIVDTGVLAVYSLQNKEEGHLIDGDFFEELSLVTDKEIRTSTVLAVTNCKILLLDKIPFRLMMRSYPELFYSLREELIKDSYLK